MIGLLLALYPARWRTRYGEEFRAVLESRPLGPFDVADVLIGALDARITRFRLAGAAGIDGGPLMMLRLGGFGAIAGGILLFAGITASSFDGEGDRTWIGLFALGTLSLLLALVGLSAFQARQHARLAWAAFAIPGIGAVVSLVGLVGMVLSTNEDAVLFGSVSAWTLWAFGLLALLVGSFLFAIATIRAAVFSRGAALLLAVSALAMLITAFGGFADNGGTELERLLFAAIVGTFAASWAALGAMALRRGPIRAIAPA